MRLSSERRLDLQSRFLQSQACLYECVGNVRIFYDRKPMGSYIQWEISASRAVHGVVVYNDVGIPCWDKRLEVPIRNEGVFFMDFKNMAVSHEGVTVTVAELFDLERQEDNALNWKHVGF